MEQQYNTPAEQERVLPVNLILEIMQRNLECNKYRS